jgi:hypothetical protein
VTPALQRRRHGASNFQICIVSMAMFVAQTKGHEGRGRRRPCGGPGVERGALDLWWR